MKILLFGEPLIRITPTHHQSLQNNQACHMYYGGSEVNIACNLAGFHIDSSMFCGLPDHPVGYSFIQFLKEHQIDTSHIAMCGDRLGLYYLINGYGCRISDVYYDRHNTSMNNISITDIDMDQLFKGITHFHFSGITVAISSHVRDILLVLLKEAKKRHIIISMDLNLRTKMISIEEAKRLFSEYAQYADYCFGIDPLMINESDTNMFDRQHATNKTIEKRMKDLQEHFGFKAVFHTIRSVDKHMINHYQAYAYNHQLYHSVHLQTSLLERVGSGDAFVSGVLYKLMQHSSLQDALDFGVAAGTYKCTILGDNMNVSANKIQGLLNEQSEISR